MHPSRPPVATERLSLLPDGRLLYCLKRRWRNGTTQMIFEPLELVEKLAAIVPPPRVNLVRYYGILAPSAAWRPIVIPESDVSDPLSHPNCPARKQLIPPDTENLQKNRVCRPRNYSWAELMKRVFSIDVLECARCGGRMRIISANHSQEAIRKILDCLGLPSRAPPVARALTERETNELDFSSSGY